MLEISPEPKGLETSPHFFSLALPYATEEEKNAQKY